ncbi:hypothetical protein [Candidatus Enterococcus clewellii]|nr:hypothetical protein [Enterococcus sp. 9E7_DIV0242]
MKKRFIFLSAAALLLLSACASESNDQQKTIEEQQQQIETLTYEKNQLESVLQARKETSSAQTSTSSDPEMESEDLEGLFQDFIHAEFEQDNEALSELTTAPLYTILTDKAGEAETDVSFQSKVKSIEIYKAEQTDDTAILIGKIEIETRVGEFAPNSYEQLIECTAERNTSGVFQIDTQVLTNLAQ